MSLYLQHILQHRSLYRRDMVHARHSYILPIQNRTLHLDYMLVLCHSCIRQIQNRTPRLDYILVPGHSYILQIQDYSPHLGYILVTGHRSIVQKCSLHLHYTVDPGHICKYRLQRDKNKLAIVSRIKCTYASSIT